MKDFAFEDLKNIVATKPINISNSFLFGEEHELLVLSNNDDVMYELETKKCFYNSKKKKGKLNITPNKEIAKYKKPIYFNWFVQRKNNCNETIIEGPYVNRQMKNLLFQNLLIGTRIKRDCDPVFLPFEFVYEKYNNFIYTDFELLSKLFQSAVIINDDTLEEKSIGTETNAWLKDHGLNTTYQSIVNLIANKTKAQAIEILKNILKQNENNCKVLLDIIIKETSWQLLLNVDKDGFVIYTDNKYRNR